MTATITITKEQLKEHLGTCPACSSSVVADAYAIWYRGAWYHLGCAIDCDKRERTTLERAE
jgi:hypothetical protein